MTRRLILKSQSNRVFELIQASGMSPSDFYWDVHDSASEQEVEVSILRHRPTEFFFQFDYYGTQHACIFSPGENVDMQSLVTDGWAKQILYFQRWLSYLKREVDAPDLWTAIADERVLSDLSSEQDENTKFAPDELERIRQNLEEIKQYLLAARAFSPEQKSYLDARFNYLNDAATRVGRKDWIILVIGTVMNIAIALALESTVARELLRLAGLLLKWTMGMPLLGP